MAKQTQTMRASKGAQRNQAKKIMTELGVEDLDMKKVKYAGIGIAAGSIILVVVLTVFFKYIGLLCAIAVSAVAFAVYMKMISDKQKKMVTAYKTLGMTKEEYAKSFEALNVNASVKKSLIDLWDKVPEPEKVYTQKGKPQQVNQSKQNKKKKKYTKKKKK